MPHRVVNVTEFKAKCLALLDDIGERGGTITITKRGRPLATVGPARRNARKSLEGAWAGRFTISDDVLDADTSELWEVVHPQPGVRG
jgi:antitoxin (DNA-binding transcriptional repressor) of toxin-antitoxin stability system